MELKRGEGGLRYSPFNDSRQLDSHPPFPFYYCNDFGRPPCNIVINGSESGRPPIRDYVIYEHPLNGLILIHLCKLIATGAEGELLEENPIRLRTSFADRAFMVLSPRLGAATFIMVLLLNLVLYKLLQVKFCKRNPGFMDSVRLGAVRAIDECQYQVCSIR